MATFICLLSACRRAVPALGNGRPGPFGFELGPAVDALVLDQRRALRSRPRVEPVRAGATAPGARDDVVVTRAAPEGECWEGMVVIVAVRVHFRLFVALPAGIFGRVLLVLHRWGMVLLLPLHVVYALTTPNELTWSWKCLFIYCGQNSFFPFTPTKCNTCPA
jgi:hypothetical protein